MWVEPLFAEAKDWHGLRRFRLRTLEKVNAEALLIGSGQNIKRLLTYAHRDPRRPAQVAALRQPAPNPYEFCDVRRHRKRGAWHLARVFQQPDVFSETPMQLGCIKPARRGGSVFRETLQCQTLITLCSSSG